jgi:hypothetical protein
VIKRVGERGRERERERERERGEREREKERKKERKNPSRGLTQSPQDQVSSWVVIRLCHAEMESLGILTRHHCDAVWSFQHQNYELSKPRCFLSPGQFPVTENGLSPHVIF